MDLTRAELRFGLSDPRGLGANPQRHGRLASRFALAAGRRKQRRPRLLRLGRRERPRRAAHAGRVRLRLPRQRLAQPRAAGRATRAGRCIRSWPSPSFAGDFLPGRAQGHAKGFDARATASAISRSAGRWSAPAMPARASTSCASADTPRRQRRRYDRVGQTASISLIQPVDLYSQVNRATKYGFLFIGFTFLALLMFDVIGGVRVSAVEYLLMGAALVLFFVLLLAFAEVIGFTPAYILASAAIAGPEHGLFRRGARQLAARGVHRRAARRALCRALHPAQPRGLLAADRLAAAVRRARRSDVRDPRIDWGAEAGTGASSVTM